MDSNLAPKSIEGKSRQPSLAAAQSRGTGLSTLVDMLKRKLAKGEIVKDGQILPERELAQSLGTSRSSLRQALDLLEESGVLWRRQGQGTFVTALRSPADGADRLLPKASSAEAFELRLEFEPMVARVSAVRATPRQLEKIAAACAKAAIAEDCNNLKQLSFEFHSAIWQATNNALFSAIAKAAWNNFETELCSSKTHQQFLIQNRVELMLQRAEIAEALIRRNEEQAERSMHRHVLAHRGLLSYSALLTSDLTAHAGSWDVHGEQPYA